MPQRLLLITYIDFGEEKSGSSVRPQHMYEDFVKLGYDVSLLWGQQNRRLERLRRVLRKYRELRRYPPDLCYIEPPSGPIFNLCDHLLMLWLHRKGVPMGLFYRDAYWKLAEWWPVHGIKRAVFKAMHRFDLFIIKHTCDVVFFPTQSMAALFDMPRKSVLPPAGKIMLSSLLPLLERNAVYVGGCSQRYGTDLMLSAFELLNEKMGEDIHLTVVCREAEMADFFTKYEGRPWLDVRHLSGEDELAPVYRKSTVALFAGRRDLYMDLCMPVKLFEYLSFGLPVVTTTCTEAARFVLQSGVGVVAQDNPQALAAAVAGLVNDTRQLLACRRHTREVLMGGNLWEHRAVQAAREILKAGTLPVKQKVNVKKVSKTEEKA